MVEVASFGTARRDRTTKLGWYRRYGVRECWLVNPFGERVVVVNWPERGRATRHEFRTNQSITSAVLPGFDRTASVLFD